MQDPVREFLRQRGCSARVVDGGLSGLIEGWERTVRSVESGYIFTFDDYLNDLDARQLIAESLTVADHDQRESVAERLRRADEDMRRATQSTPLCLWGREVAEEKGWTPNKNWWYYTRPLRAPSELLSEIDSVASL